MKRWILPMIVAVLVLGIAVTLVMRKLSPRTYTDADFRIATYHSQQDRDGDGVDDQADFLQGVRDYIATRPKYKSSYYAGGYPDDGYGVCTDVVAFGMRSAGYDLMELVAADVEANPSAYQIVIPDPNIDFRRVRNLAVYFRENSVSLTTDLTQIDQWQGGDIVVFPKHIAVVSDRRNREGIPLLIHHASKWQASYEEDVLERYAADEIVGHYRLS